MTWRYLDLEFETKEQRDWFEKGYEECLLRMQKILKEKHKLRELAIPF